MADRTDRPDRPDRPPADALAEARREAEYYRQLAEDAGRRHLREAEALSALLARAQQAERELQHTRDGLERRVEERTAELRASEEAFRSFMGHFPGLAYIKEADTTVVFANEGFRTYLGLDPAALVGRTNAQCFPEPFASAITQDDLRVLETGQAATIGEEFGGRSWTTHKFVIPRGDGAPRLGGLTLDVTEARQAEEGRRQLERQVEQAQRLESLGVLAGGIAHDFNNLLTTILTNVALLRGDVPAAGRECLEDVDAAARAAAGLCQQMLAYAGRAAFAAEPVELGELVRGMVQLLRSSISRRLGLELRLGAGLPPVKGDRSQLQQVVMNLVINAAEAMADGDGAVVVSTGVEEAAPERLRAALLGEGLGAGRYVALEVADAGCGMDAATQRRIFEPFFTSKFAGRGLGLSAVLGIVRQLGGAIEVESAPGRGSRFRVLLPASAAAPAAPGATPASAARGATGTVLVVDDDAAVRRSVGRMLRRLGYEVLEAGDGAEGIERYRQARGAIRAVVLDLTMPGLDGVQTFRALRAADPRAFVIVASGFAEAEVVARFAGDPPNAFAQKPFGIEALDAALRAAPERLPARDPS